MAAADLLALDFEVFGTVQGVFFRKYTQRKAKELGVRGWCKNTEQGTVIGQLEGAGGPVTAMYDFDASTLYTHDQAVKLGLRGWCMNTRHGTVVGQLEGPRDKMASMKDWLQRVGSPSSRITKTEFKNEHEIQEYSFKGFSIKH